MRADAGHVSAPRGGAAGARWTGECLGDVQPPAGLDAVGVQVEVGRVTALGDQQAEVEGVSGDALRGVLGSVDPRRAVGRGQFDAERLGGRGDPVQRVGEVAGADAEADDVPQPGGRLPRGAECVGDVLAVCPGLHDPGRGHAGDADRRPVPGEPAAWRLCGQRQEQFGAAGAPVGEQFTGLLRGARLGARVDEAVRVGRGRRLCLAVEGVLVAGREQGAPVGPGQVGDLVGDGPAGGGRGACPQAGGDVGARCDEQGVQVVAFGPKVLQDAVHDVGHDSESDSEAENKQACLPSFRPCLRGGARAGCRP